MQSNDRLSRGDGDEAFAELKQLARWGVQPWFYAEGWPFRYGTFESNVTGILKSEFAAEYRRAIAVKTREAMQRKAQLGFVTGGTGLLTCAVCGGAMEVLSSKSGARRMFSYRCSVRRRKGEACCTNGLAAPMHETDSAVLRAIESTLLDPRVVQKALQHAERAIARDKNAVNVRALEKQLSDCEKAIRRLTAAIASGDDHLPTLVTALETQERHRKELETRLDTARQPQTQFDSASIRAQLESYISDLQGLLRGHVYQAQQVLRRLIRGRIAMTPKHVGGFGKSYYTFAARGTIQPLVGAVVLSFLRDR
jgi:hypothetical protein